MEVSQPTRAIAERLDVLPLKALHAAIVCACAVGFGLDLLEVSISNALSAVFSAPPYTLSPAAVSWLLASVYGGAVVGAPIAGRIADRRGLQRTLTVVFVWMGMMSVLAAVRPDPVWFGFFRFLSGIALGACPPLMIAYLTGVAPPRSRGLLIFWVCGMAYLMPPVGVFLLRWLTPLHPLGIEGWRWPFLLAGIGAVFIGFLFVRLPESPGWLARMGHDRLASGVVERFERSRTWGLLEWGPKGHSDTRPSPSAAAAGVSCGDSRSIRRRLAYFVCLSFLQPWVTASFQLLTGPMLLKRGYNLNDALFYVAIATFGPTIGTLSSGFLVDRARRRTSLLLTGALMAVALGIFFGFDQRPMLAIAVIGFSIGVAVYTPIMTLSGAELFPTTVRASATGFAWAANRLAAVIVPVLVMPLFADFGASIVALVVSVSLLLAAILAVFGPRGAAGVEVD